METESWHYVQVQHLYRNNLQLRHLEHTYVAERPNHLQGKTIPACAMLGPVEYMPVHGDVNLHLRPSNVLVLRPGFLLQKLYLRFN